MSTLLDRTDPVMPTAEERRLAVESGRRLTPLLGDRDRLTIRIDRGEEPGESLVLPASAVRLLSAILDRLARGEAVALVTELTTEQAADLLGVSAPFLQGFLDRGEIPSRLAGMERRIQFRDLLDFKKRNEVARLETLRELTDLSQELGLY